MGPTFSQGLGLPVCTHEGHPGPGGGTHHRDTMAPGGGWHGNPLGIPMPQVRSTMGTLWVPPGLEEGTLGDTVVLGLWVMGGGCSGDPLGTPWLWVEGTMGTFWATPIPGRGHHGDPLGTSWPQLGDAVVLGPGISWLWMVDAVGTLWGHPNPGWGRRWGPSGGTLIHGRGCSLWGHRGPSVSATPLSAGSDPAADPASPLPQSKAH